MKQLIVLLLISTFTNFDLLNAQDSENNWGFGLGYTLTPAEGILSDNGHGTSHGVFTDLFFLGLKNKFISLSPGLRFNIGSAFGDRVDVRLPDPDIEIGNVRMTNSNANLRLAIRVGILENWVIKPYGEFSAGIGFSSANHIFSLNGNNDFDEDSGTTSNRDRINKNFTSLYGFGIGALIPVSDNIDIDLRFNQDWVGSLTYLNLDEDINSDFFVTDNVRRMSFNVGVNFRFNDCKEDGESETIE